MRKSLTAAVLLLAAIPVSSQTAVTVPTEVEQARAVADALVGQRVKAVVLFKDLTHIDGSYIVKVDQNEFQISRDRKGRAGLPVRYADVLAIFSHRASISFVPDPKAAPYGNWSDVEKLLPNTLIEVTDTKGEIKAARYRSHGTDHLVLAERDRAGEWTIRREEIASIHRVRYGYRDISGNMAGGVEKGNKVGKEVADVLASARGPISGQPLGTRSAASPLGAAMGAVAGVMKGILTGSETLRVLVYSK